MKTEERYYNNSPFTNAPCIWKCLRWWNAQDSIRLRSISVAGNESIKEYYDPISQQHYMIKQKEEPRRTATDPETLKWAEKQIEERARKLELLGV